MSDTDLRPEREELLQALRVVLGQEEHVLRAWLAEALPEMIRAHPGEVLDLMQGVVRESIKREELIGRRALLDELVELAKLQPAELGAWLHDVLQGNARLLAAVSKAGHVPESAESSVRRLVQTALETSPFAVRAVAPAKELALFPTGATSAPLPPISAHVAEGAYAVHLPEGLLEEPLEASLARDPLPLPTTADREGYHAEHHYDYWLSGLDDWLRLRAVLRRHGAELRPGAATLDFGCATGRVLRHELCQVDGLDVWGVDLNERHIEWLCAHMPRRLKAFQCTALPSLPLPDAHFDLVTAYSVFTHIDEFELAWLVELRRILRPGGIAYLTIHSDLTWPKVKPGMALFEHMHVARDSIHDFKISKELFQKPMPRDKTVIRWSSARLNNTNVFLSRRHVNEVWGRFFDVLELVPEGDSYQDVVVLRKPG